MALEGTLEDFSLADIFQLIGIQRKTGVLTLKNNQETVTVTFYNGMVIGADSSPKKLEDRIGKVLVKTGLIGQKQLEEALQQQQKTLQKIGFILIDQNYISKDELKEALQIQVAQMIYRLFRWNKGDFYFDQKARVDPDADESIPPMSAESILMEGIQMIDEWPVIQKRIPNFDIVFRPLLKVEDLEFSEEEEWTGAGVAAGAIPSGMRADPSEKVRLSKEEGSIYRLLDGRNSVAEVIERSKMGEFHTCKTLYDLLERKIIEPLRPAGRPIKEPTFTVRARAERKVDVKFGYILIVLAVGALIALNYRDPLRLALLPFLNTANNTSIQRSVSISRLNMIDSAIILHYYANGVLPQSLKDLVDNKYLREDYLFDPWSRPYFYEAESDGYLLSAYNERGELDKELQFRRDLPPLQQQGKKENGLTVGIRLN